MTDDQAELINKLAMSLDACLDLARREANKERRAGEGKALRPVTWQQRAESFPKLIEAARVALDDAERPVFF